MPFFFIKTCLLINGAKTGKHSRTWVNIALCLIYFYRAKFPFPTFLRIYLPTSYRQMHSPNKIRCHRVCSARCCLPHYRECSLAIIICKYVFRSHFINVSSKWSDSIHIVLFFLVPKPLECEVIKAESVKHRQRKRSLVCIIFVWCEQLDQYT